MKFLAKTFLTCAVFFLLNGTGMTLHGQAPEDAKSSMRAVPADPHGSQADFVVKAYRVINMTQQGEASDLLTALRNILSASNRMYLDFSANTIVLAAPPDQQQIAQMLLEKLDVPRPTYRVTYTLTETDAGKRIGTQHYALTAADGQKTTLKQGSKVPVVTGVTGSGGGSTSQFQYLDVGMNFSVEADAAGSGVLLKTKVEESSVPEERAIAGVQEPIIRQAVVESSSVIPFGKPFMLGSMDVLGSTRRIDVEVLVEPLSAGAGGR